MSDILELRQRVEAAEGKFGVSAADQTKYSERLISLVNAVETAAKDAREDQEKTKMSLLAAQAENEQLRGMLHTLLLAVEKDGDAIGPVLRDLEQAVSAISAAGVPQSADPGESGEVLAEAPAEPEQAQPAPADQEAPAEELLAESDEPAEMPAADEPPAPAAEPESETVFSSDQDLDAAPDDVALDEDPEPVAEDLAVDAAETEDIVAEEPAIEEPAVEEPSDDAPMAALEMEEADAIDLEIDEIEPVEDTAETDLVADDEAPGDDEALADDQALADDAVAELLMESDDAEGPEAGADEDILTDLDIEDLAADALAEEEEPAEEAPVAEDLEAEDLVDEGLVLEDIDAEPDLVADAEVPPEPEAAELEVAEPDAAEPDALDSDEIETLLVDDVEESDDNAIDLEFEASIEAETPPDLIAPVEEDEVDLLADEAIEEALLNGADDEEEVSMQALAEQLRQKNEAMANGAESANQGG